MISATGDALLLCCNRSWTQFAVVLKLGPWSSRGLQSSFTETVYFPRLLANYFAARSQIGYTELSR